MNDSREILWLAVEDYSGLWEAVWQLRAHHSEVGDDDLLRRARVALAILVERRLVELYRCQEPYGELSLIDGAEAPQVLADDRSWIEPGPKDVSIRFSATPVGERRTRGGQAGLILQNPRNVSGYLIRRSCLPEVRHE